MWRCGQTVLCILVTQLKNINEYAHGRLKQYFKDSKCDFREAIHNMLTLQFT